MAVNNFRHNLPSPPTSISTTDSITSINPASLDGGVGTITVGLDGQTDPLELWGRDYWVASDNAPDYWKRYFRVVGSTWSQEDVSITGENAFRLLNVTRTIRPPMGSSLSAKIQDVFHQFGIDTTEHPIYGLPTTGGGFALPGYRGTGWEYVKMFCIAYGYDLVLVEDIFYFRQYNPLRNLEKKLIARSFSLDATQTASKISLNLYNSVSAIGTYVEFTPFNNPGTQILTVNSGEVVNYSLSTNAWISSVNQPPPMNFIGPEERSDTGGYCVVGGDGFPMTAAEWVGLGGGLSVAINPDDPTVIDVTLTGANAPSMGPFTIAADPGDTSYANSLHITGTGVRFRKQTMEFATGGDTNENNIVTIDNPFVMRDSQAYRLGHTAACFAAGPVYTGSLSLYVDLRPTDLLGSRFLWKGSVFRILSVTQSESGQTVSCVADTTLGDFNDAWPTGTFNDFNAQWPSETFEQYSVRSLQRG